ncbi:MAG: hypothetical protein C0630_07510 [Sedimenticola selenatireducens]|uniref:Uncharacterized protein n=1 Tax=Sedimenticola selenatireducens TaxID=191960 RepID=A0A2N6CY62_9GAMM|nr:MAG: hypothetical protein C0630_07510 [Sedimenticola selenatireducens]
MLDFPALLLMDLFSTNLVRRVCDKMPIIIGNPTILSSIQNNSRPYVRLQLVRYLAMRLDYSRETETDRR